MEYKNIINLADSTPSQSSKFTTKNCVKTNDESWETYDIGSQIRLRTSVLTANPIQDGGRGGR